MEGGGGRQWQAETERSPLPLPEQTAGTEARGSQAERSFHGREEDESQCHHPQAGSARGALGFLGLQTCPREETRKDRAEWRQPRGPVCMFALWVTWKFSGPGAWEKERVKSETEKQTKQEWGDQGGEGGRREMGAWLVFQSKRSLVERVSGVMGHGPSQNKCGPGLAGNTRVSLKEIGNLEEKVI